MFHIVSEVASSCMIHHHAEKAMFSFPSHRDVVISCKSSAIFTATLSCYEVVTKARYLCNVRTVFSADSEIPPLFCHMVETLSDELSNHVIAVIWPKRCERVKKCLFP